MLLPHQHSELIELLLKIKNVLYCEDEIVHLPTQLDEIKEIVEEIEEIIDLD